MTIAENNNQVIANAINVAMRPSPDIDVSRTSVEFLDFAALNAALTRSAHRSRSVGRWNCDLEWVTVSISGSRTLILAKQYTQLNLPIATTKIMYR